jgi:hypothetical protein
MHNLLFSLNFFITIFIIVFYIRFPNKINKALVIGNLSLSTFYNEKGQQFYNCQTIRHYGPFFFAIVVLFDCNFSSKTDV